MAHSFNTSLKNIASLYLESLRVKVTSTTIKKEIEENPYYPSLLSISDTFHRYNIDNSVFKVARDKVLEIEPPFIAFITIPGVGKDFVLVKSIDSNNVDYLYRNKKLQSLERDKFLRSYQGVVLVAEANEYSQEADFEVKLANEKSKQFKKAVWFIGIATVLILAGANISVPYFEAFIAILALKCLGLVSTVLLLVYEIDKSNSFVKNLCSAGGHTNCDAVLTSKASKILGMSWGEIGFFYFATSALYLLAPAVSFTDKFSIIALANSIAAPYILFSIYYQWRIVKQWCPLCLTVQVVLSMELIWSIVNFWHSSNCFSFTLSQFPSLGLAVLLPIIGWYGLKPIFIKFKDGQLFNSAYKRLQYNPEIFNALLLQQDKAAEGWQNLGINIGNPEAATTIIKVCNPYCGPCTKAHLVLDEIVNQNPNVQLKIIFVSKNLDYDRGALVVKHLLAIASEQDVLKTQQALDDWYLANKKDYLGFASNYPVTVELKDQDSKLEAMAQWCEDAEISYTPTFFVNGYKLPENYDIAEIQNIL